MNTNNYYTFTEESIIDEFERCFLWEIESQLNWKFNDRIKDMEIAFNEDNHLIHEIVHELIDQSQYVIYTGQAKQVVEQFNYFTPFCVAESTGERFASWSHCAYDNIYKALYDNLDFEEIVARFLARERSKQIYTNSKPF